MSRFVRHRDEQRESILRTTDRIQFKPELDSPRQPICLSEPPLFQWTLQIQPKRRIQYTVWSLRTPVFSCCRNASFRRKVGNGGTSGCRLQRDTRFGGNG